MRPRLPDYLSGTIKEGGAGDRLAIWTTSRAKAFNARRLIGASAQQRHYPPRGQRAKHRQHSGLLQGSDTPIDDQLALFKAQIVFWLIGATDGHSKNFSIFIRPGGFRPTPFYDVLTAQPSLDAHQLQRNKFKPAMFVGKNNHYRIFEVRGRHFVETTKAAGFGPTLITRAITEIRARGETTFDAIANEMPADLRYKFTRA